MSGLPTPRPAGATGTTSSQPRLVAVGGQRMFVHDFAVDRHISPLLAAGVAHEPFETEWLINSLRPGDSVLDIGAHIGYFTLLCARLVGPQGRVFAFEPDRGNFQLLQKNIDLNGCRNVRLFHLAVAHQSGFAQLYLSRDNAGDHRVWGGEEARAAVPIQTVELDRLFADPSERFDLIKMDVQGGEWSALQGMRQLIGRQPRLTLVTEFWPWGLQASGGNAANYLAMLHDLRFRLYLMDEIERRLSRVETDELLRTIEPVADRFVNLLCIKTDLSRQG